MSMMRRRESERDLPAPRASKADEAARARSSLGLRSLLASYGRWQGATVCGIGCVGGGGQCWGAVAVGGRRWVCGGREWGGRVRVGRKGSGAGLRVRGGCVGWGGAGGAIKGGGRVRPVHGHGPAGSSLLARLNPSQGGQGRARPPFGSLSKRGPGYHLASPPRAKSSEMRPVIELRIPPTRT